MEEKEKTPEELGWTFTATRGSSYGNGKDYSYRVSGYNTITGQVAPEQTSIRAHSAEYAINLFKIWLPEEPKAK